MVKSKKLVLGLLLAAAVAVITFALFVLYLVVSLFLRDPARPFRMFKAPPLESSPESGVHPSAGSGQGSPEEEQGSAGEEEI